MCKHKDLDRISQLEATTIWAETILHGFSTDWKELNLRLSTSVTHMTPINGHSDTKILMTSCFSIQQLVITIYNSFSPMLADGTKSEDSLVQADSVPGPSGFVRFLSCSNNNAIWMLNTLPSGFVGNRHCLWRWDQTGSSYTHTHILRICVCICVTCICVCIYTHRR